MAVNGISPHMLPLTTGLSSNIRNFFTHYNCIYIKSNIYFSIIELFQVL